MYTKFVKRLIDIVLSGIGLLVLATPMLIVAIIIDVKILVLLFSNRSVSDFTRSTSIYINSAV